MRFSKGTFAPYINAIHQTRQPSQLQSAVRGTEQDINTVSTFLIAEGKVMPCQFT